MKLPRTHKIILLIAAVLFIIAAVMGLSGCTEREKKNGKAAGRTISEMVGLPPIVGESIAGVVISAISAWGGHRRGRRKERACHVHNPLVPKAPTP